jgi:hypothetical protein
MKVRQLVMTNFNERFDTIYTHSLDEEWLKYRWKLFTTFTVPSMLGQSQTDFDWVILCHPKSPSWFKSITKTLEVPIRIHFEFDSPTPTIPGLNDPNLDAVLTTNLDSDDAINRCYLERVRSFFEAEPFKYELFEIEDGYKYDYSCQRIAPWQWKSSPFSTRVNFGPNIDPFDFGGAHDKHYGKYKNVEISRGDPLFLQVVHDKNNATRRQLQYAYQTRKFSRHILNKAFNVDDPIRNMQFQGYVYDLLRDSKQLIKFLVHRGSL